jgi:hypothetical protein
MGNNEVKRVKADVEGMKHGEYKAKNGPRLLIRDVPLQQQGYYNIELRRYVSNRVV